MDASNASAVSLSIGQCRYVYRYASRFDDHPRARGSQQGAGRGGRPCGRKVPMWAQVGTCRMVDGAGLVGAGEAGAHVPTRWQNPGVSKRVSDRIGTCQGRGERPELLPAVAASERYNADRTGLVGGWPQGEPFRKSEDFASLTKTAPAVTAGSSNPRAQQRRQRRVSRVPKVRVVAAICLSKFRAHARRFRRSRGLS